MCIVLGKYFPNVGWIGFKQRDRNYPAVVDFKRSFKDGVERFYLVDEKTKYSEGLNEFGISILSAAVMVKKDEDEADAASSRDENYYAPDGIRIRKALLEKTVEKSLDSLIESEIPGNTLVFDSKNMYLLEGAFEDYYGPNKTYVYETKKIKVGETVVRTNHGIWLPWSGYQIDDPEQKESRKSSENRLKVVRKSLKNVSEPRDLFEICSNTDNKDTQMNPLRLDTGKEKMRTTGQMMVDPKELTLHYRPIMCKMNIDYNKLIEPKYKTGFEIISSKKLFTMKEYFNRGE